MSHHYHDGGSFSSGNWTGLRDESDYPTVEEQTEASNRAEELAGMLTTTGYTSWKDHNGQEVMGADIHEAYVDLAAEFVALMEERGCV